MSDTAPVAAPSKRTCEVEVDWSPLVSSESSNGEDAAATVKEHEAKRAKYDSDMALMNASKEELEAKIKQRTIQWAAAIRHAELEKERIDKLSQEAQLKLDLVKNGEERFVEYLKNLHKDRKKYGETLAHLEANHDYIMEQAKKYLKEMQTKVEIDDENARFNTLLFKLSQRQLENRKKQGSISDETIKEFEEGWLADLQDQMSEDPRIESWNEKEIHHLNQFMTCFEENGSCLQAAKLYYMWKDVCKGGKIDEEFRIKELLKRKELLRDN